MEYENSVCYLTGVLFVECWNESGNQLFSTRLGDASFGSNMPSPIYSRSHRMLLTDTRMGDGKRLVAVNVRTGDVAWQVDCQTLPYDCASSSSTADVQIPLTFDNYGGDSVYWNPAGNWIVKLGTNVVKTAAPTTSPTMAPTATPTMEPEMTQEPTVAETQEPTMEPSSSRRTLLIGEMAAVLCALQLLAMAW